MPILCPSCAEIIPENTNVCPCCGTVLPDARPAAPGNEDDRTIRITSATPPPPPPSRQATARKAPPILYVVICILAILLALALWFLFSHTQPVQPRPVQTPEIPADSRSESESRPEVTEVLAPVEPEVTNQTAQRSQTATTVPGIESLVGTHSVSGYINDEYPITGTITVRPDGHVSGKYAYLTTLSKAGDKPSSWIKISGRTTDGHRLRLSHVCPNAEPWPDIDATIEESYGGIELNGHWTHNGYWTIILTSD